MTEQEGELESILLCRKAMVPGQKVSDTFPAAGRQVEKCLTLFAVVPAAVRQSRIYLKTWRLQIVDGLVGIIRHPQFEIRNVEVFG